MNLDKKTKIAFIGAGKIASSIVPALIKKGYKVECIISRDIKSAKRLALKNKIRTFSDSTDVLATFKGTLFLTVPDSSLEPLAKTLSEQKLFFSELLFVHTSGALSSDTLEKLKNKRSLTASFHILQTFPSITPVKISGCYSAVESSSKKCKDYLVKLSESLGMIPFMLRREDKIKYHLAAVFASNFINAVLYASSKLFGEIKETPSDHFTVFEPIIKSVIHNIKQKGAAGALSGPVERGDIKTIKKHLTALNRSDYEFLETYTANSLMLVEAAEEKYNGSNKIEKKTMEEIAKLLIKELYG